FQQNTKWYRHTIYFETGNLPKPHTGSSCKGIGSIKTYETGNREQGKQKRFYWMMISEKTINWVVPDARLFLREESALTIWLFTLSCEIFICSAISRCFRSWNLLRLNAVRCFAGSLLTP